MEVVGAVALISSIASLLRAVHGIVLGIEEVSRGYRDADRNVLRLRAAVNSFELIIEELQTWLQDRPTLPPKFSNTIQDSITACTVIVDDIAEAVAKSQPVEGETSARFMQKVRLLWNEAAIKDHERMLSNQLQQFHLIIFLKTQNEQNPGIADTLVERPENQEKLMKAQDDARTIRNSRGSGTVTTSLFSDHGENFSVVLDVDDELVMTGPYQRQLRHLLNRQFGRSTSQLPTPEPTELNQRMNSISLQPSVFSLRSLETYDVVRPSPPSYHDAENLSVSASSPATLVPQEVTVDQLCDAVEGHNLESIRDLINEGVPLSSYGTGGFTPLGIAVRAQRLNVVQLLLDRQANVEYGEQRLGWRPIHLAASVGSADIALELLRKHAIARTELSGGKQAIHIAAEKGSSGVLRHLIHYGADWGAQYQSKDISGVTPLHVAHGSVVDMLINIGADPHSVDSRGCLPIHYAARRCDIQAMRAFLRSGVSINARDNNRYNPLMHTCLADAEPRQLEEVMIFLLSSRSELPAPGFLHRVLTSRNPSLKTIATAVRIFHGAGYDLNFKARYNYLPSSLSHIPSAEWKVTLLGQLCCSLRRFADEAITAYTKLVKTLVDLQAGVTVPDNASSAAKLLSPLNLLVESLIFFEQADESPEVSADFIVPSNDVAAFLNIACALIKAGAEFDWIKRRLTGPHNGAQDWNSRRSSADARELLVERLFECFAQDSRSPSGWTGYSRQDTISDQLRASLCVFQFSDGSRQSFQPFQMELKRIIREIPDHL